MPSISRLTSYICIEHNDSIAINAAIESRNENFVKNIFSSITRTEYLITSTSGAKVNDQNTNEDYSSKLKIRKNERAIKAKSISNPKH